MSKAIEVEAGATALGVVGWRIAVMMPPTMSMVRMASAWPETLHRSIRMVLAPCILQISWAFSEGGNNAVALRPSGITRPDPALHDPEHRAGATAPHGPGYWQCDL